HTYSPGVPPRWNLRPDIHKLFTAKVLRLLASEPKLHRRALNFTLPEPPMPATAQSTDDPHAKDRRAISQLLTTQQDDWNKGNVDAFMSAYWKSPDLT